MFLFFMYSFRFATHLPPPYTAKDIISYELAAVCDFCLISNQMLVKYPGGAGGYAGIEELRAGEILGCLALLDNYFEGTVYGTCRAYSFAPGAPATISCLNESYNIPQQHQ
jgi:hypothetical protein